MKNYSGSLALLLVAALAAAPGIAQAHAFPKTAEPASDSTVSPAPREVKIWFTGKLEPAFSKLDVQDAAGRGRRSGRCCGRPARHNPDACLAGAAPGGDLQGPLACGLGRYACDRRHLYLYGEIAADDRNRAKQWIRCSLQRGRCISPARCRLLGALGFVAFIAVTRRLGRCGNCVLWHSSARHCCSSRRRSGSSSSPRI